MASPPTPALVSTEWLAARLGDPAVRVLDATWFLPNMNRDADAEFAREHIPGTVRFSVDVVADTASKLPHMLPSAVRFASWAKRLGVGDAHHVIVYDRAGGGSAAARVWWMFRVFGHDSVSVLDGGLTKWQAEGRPVTAATATLVERHFVPRPVSGLVRDLAAMKANLGTHAAQVIDARSRGRFAGTEKEIWPHRKVGHMPGALNLPWGDLLDPETKTFVPADELARRFKASGLDLAKPVIASCGSGVSACVLALGLFTLGKIEVAVYDGSWAEWGTQEDTPAVTGDA